MPWGNHFKLKKNINNKPLIVLKLLGLPLLNEIYPSILDIAHPLPLIQPI
jgi:hypothetical protein